MTTDNIYCTYLTVYYGNKLPPFYIGSSSIHKVETGYHGSVSSRLYKKVWKSELKTNPSQFKTFIITTHSTRELAYLTEKKIQTTFNVIHNPLYINQSILNEKFTTSGLPVSDSTRKKLSRLHKGKTVTTETRIKLAAAQTGNTLSEETKSKLSMIHKSKWENPEYRQAKVLKARQVNSSPEYREKMRISSTGRHHTEETKNKIANSRKGKLNPMFGKPAHNRGKKHSPESIQKMKDAKAKRKPN